MSDTRGPGSGSGSGSGSDSDSGSGAASADESDSDAHDDDGFDEPTDATDVDETGRTADGSEPDDGYEDEGPLGELSATVRARGAPSSSAVLDSDDEGDVGDAVALFEHEAVDGIDPDALWERLQRGDAAAFDADEDTDAFDADEPPLTDREIRDVQKRAYCHGCEHFEEPPHVGCTHEGTDILEFPSLETVRVADCPVVIEDEALEDRR